MNTLARISVILFLLLSAAPSVLYAAPAPAAHSTDTPALPAAAQAAGATPTWWATVQADRPDRFHLAMLGRTPFGRGKVKLEWEVKPRGVLFDGTGVQRSAAWLDSGTAGVQLNELVTGLDANTLYHWRVRLRYHPATTPFQAYSRWLTNPWNGWNEARLRTAPAVPVAVTVASLDATTASGSDLPAWLLGLVVALSLIVGFVLANRPIKIRRQQ